MRILYLCHRIPYPPDKGDKIRAFHQLRALAEAGHEVDLFTLADDPRDLAGQPALAAFCRRVEVAQLNPRFARLRSLPFLLTAEPLTVPYFHSSELRRGVREAFAGRSYDRIFVYCSAMAQYVDGTSGIPVISDFVDVDSDKWRQYAGYSVFPFSAIYRREAHALRAWERRAAEQAAVTVVTTEREARLLRGIAPKARVEAVPNGVDTEFFQPPASLPAAPAISFTGDMSYFPNQEAVTWFASSVLPLVRQAVPEVRFLIIGRNPSRKVETLSALPGVEVTGFVPDVRVYLARTQVSVAPFSIAAGIQNKILEAMAFGLPVVATSRAAQGLSNEAAAAVEIADKPTDIATRIVNLLQNPQMAHSRGLEGRRRVVEGYCWKRSLNRLLELVTHPSTASLNWSPAPH